MSRSLDTVVRDTLGNQAWQIVQQAAQIEQLMEENAHLKAAVNEQIKDVVKQPAKQAK